MLPWRRAIDRLLLGLVLLSASVVCGADVAFEAELNAAAVPLQDDGIGVTRLLDPARDARVVLLGEASHGTHEFYAWRSRLSRELIEAGGVAFVAIEGDTATLAPLDRYVRQFPGAPRSARAALAGITHWPSWVWANAELADFAEWLHAFNRRQPPARRVAIHGLDLYAIAGALDAVGRFGRRHAPLLGAYVSRLQSLFAPFRDRPSAYADMVMQTGRSLSPYAQAIADDLERRYRHASPESREAHFLALQHARAAAAGLRYLDVLPGPPTLSANVRSSHFGLTLRRLLDHAGDAARGIVWAHNTHVGDSRGTGGRFIEELSLGQLARRALGARKVFILGFGTGVGEVVAARRWGDPCEVLPIPAPRRDSLEAAMLAGGEQERLWLFPAGEPATRSLTQWIAHRAIGSTFEPASEARDNYVPTRLAVRYDAFLFLPHTGPLQVLDWPSGEARCSRDQPD
jgi:erythromycin esterase-like protein